MDLVNHLNRVN